MSSLPWYPCQQHPAPSNSTTSLPLHYPLVMLAVFSFLCSIYDAIKVQFLVLEHFSNILQHVLCYYPPRPVWRDSGPASGPPSRATHCPSTHRYPPHLCTVLRGLPCPALSHDFIEFVPFNMVAFSPPVFPFSFLNPGAMFMLAFRTINSFDTYPAAK